MIGRLRRLAAPQLSADSIRRNTGFALAMRIVGAVFTGALTLFLVRYLGPDDYGAYALAISVGGLFLLPMDFGVSRSAARFIAERRDDAAQVGAVLLRSIRLKAIGSGLAALLLVALAGPISSAYGESDLEWPIRIVAFAAFAQSFMLLFTTTFEALGINSVGFVIALSESALECMSSLILVLAGAGVAGAVGGRAIGYGVAATLAAVLTLRAVSVGRRASSGAAGLSLRRIASYAGALFVIDAAFAAFGYIDILLIGAFLDPRSVGFFSAPLQVLIFAQYGGLALAASLGPRLSRSVEGGPDSASFQTGLRLLLLVQLVIVAPIVVWATPITHLLFGSGYGASADVLRGLAPYAVLVGPAPMLALSINYLGEARRRIPLALGAVAINAGIDALLIPRIGVVAGAIGTDVAFLFFTVGHLLIARSLIELDLHRLGGTLLRAGIAAAAMSSVFLAFGTESLSAGQAVTGSVLGLAAYAAVLMASGEVSPAEIRAARSAVGGARRPAT
jgi:O-antigen/teichoic acid export membrane protein